MLLNKNQTPPKTINKIETLNKKDVNTIAPGLRLPHRQCNKLVAAFTWHIWSASDPHRFLCGIDLFLKCVPNVGYCIHGSNKSVRSVSRAHLTHLWTGGDIMDVLSLSGILNLILMKAQQERAFLCLLLQLRRRRTAQQRQFLVRSLYLP